ncbi:MAG: MFS transporter [Desulfobacterales bacterium]|nr:MFS transporter [Desulfobacterales bacterium]
MSESNRNFNWLKIIVLCIAGGAIYMLPYMKLGYYDAMIKGLELTNTQLGTLMAMFGGFGIPGYFIGGFLADKFRAKNLLLFSFFGTGLGGLYMSTLPSYNAMLFIFALWGLTTLVTFWPSFMKIARLSAGKDEQGKIFGIITGGRSASYIAIAAVSMWLFSLYPAEKDVAGFQTSAVFLSLVCIAVGILILLVWKEDETVDSPSQALTVKDVLEAMKMPEVWMLCTIMFGTYGIMRMADFLTPYASQQLQLSASLAGTFGYAKTYGVGIFSAMCVARFSDRVGRLRWCGVAVVICMITAGVLIFTPVSSQILSVCVVLFMMFFAWAAYMVTLALMDDARIPDRLSGTVIGVICGLGYLPEVTAPMMGGWALDRYPGIEGFHLIFGFAIAHGLLALATYGVFSVYTKRKYASEPETVSVSTV